MAHKALKFSIYEHKLLAVARRTGLRRKKILVAVSGGMDSMALLYGLHRINSILKNHIVVAHVHHGKAKTQRNSNFRDRAQEFVKGQAKILGVDFISQSQKNHRKLTSESELREYRYKKLNLWQKKVGADWIVTAHHKDDLLETRLIRLIRGTSSAGLVAMSETKHRLMRPLLDFSHDEISVWAKKIKVPFLNDPSNKEIDPLRNWLRHKWLPQLERKRKGGNSALARSLQIICEELSRSELDVVVKNAQRGDKLLRSELDKMPEILQKSVIAAFLQQRGIRNYTQGQINEIIRRLDNPQAEFTFTVLKHRWRINAELIQIKPLSSLL